LPAHKVGQQLSQLIQSRRAGEVVADVSSHVGCPECSRRCRTEAKKREIHSIDGPIEVMEAVALCRRCRRSFFPSA
jgi:C4-type Zn-finger protein